MPDSLTRLDPTPVGSVSGVLAQLQAARDLLNNNEDESKGDKLGDEAGDLQTRFVAEPIRSISDVITKLEFVVGEDALDSIDEEIIVAAISFLRGQVL